jgi:glutathione S-transferase
MLAGAEARRDAIGDIAMYKLFYADGSAAMSTRVVLEEIGVACELIQTDISRDKPRAPKLLKLNPNGWVPVLVYDGGTMHEASAITIFLTDRHPGAGLAPAADDPARGPFLQWLVYMSNTLQIAYQLTYHWDRYCAGPDAQASVQRKSCARLREVWGFIDAAIGAKDWLVADRYTAADIHLYMLTTWLSPEMGHPTMDDFPNAKRVASHAAQRPAIRKVFGL